MNSQIRKLAIIAFAAALPLGLAAQSSSAGSSTSDTTRSTTSGSSSSDRSSATRGSSTTGSSMSSPSSSTGTATGNSGSTTSSTLGSGSTSAGLQGISRIDQDSIKQQFTATDLIGKDVYDNGGKKVGEVKDLVLGSAAGSHLAMAFANSTGSDDSASRSGTTAASGRTTTGATSGTSERSTGSTYGSTSGTGSTGSTAGVTGAGSTSRIAGTDRTSSAGSTTGTAGASTLASDVTSAFNSMTGVASEPAAIVSLGGFMGMGDNLVRVPLSQLNYDSSNERLTLALSETELSSLTDRGSTRNAAE